MLDKSVPYVGIAMRRPGNAPKFYAELPPGYSIVLYRPGDERHWARIETSVEEFSDEDAALALFVKDFMPHHQELARRCLFAVNPSGQKVGTLNAWYGEMNGETVAWLHWVAVCPEEQGKGLAKALIARGLALFDELHPGKDAYLHTQTWSHVAIRLYRRAGFEVMQGDTPEEMQKFARAAYILTCIEQGSGRMTTEQKLNQPQAEDRLVAAEAAAGEVFPPKSEVYVNNHIHTIYSFSPYSPTLALYRARTAGLATAGIMDHDSVAGALEFAKAGELMGIATTTGLECRVSMAGTPFADRRLNNPDQPGNAYMAMHGIPRQNLDAVTEFLRPVRAARDARNRLMVDRLNAALSPAGVSVHYEKDVRPLSQWEDGGSVTERHLCFAAARALIARYGAGAPLLAALAAIGATPSEKIAAYLSDADNEYIDYDLLGLLKSDLVGGFYVPATEECPPVRDFPALCHRVGAIAAYPYLGDVGESVTGDKKAQTFEDGYLDELFAHLKDWGFDAVTYMPSRNTDAQLSRVQALCARHGFFEISGEDINSPRQSFICSALARPDFAHLRTATWALIGHEREASKDIALGMFSKETIAKYPALGDRIDHFASVGADGT